LSEFATPAIIQKIVESQKQGLLFGVYSICSANLYVIQACLEHALTEKTWLLIESTCNQVNQFGGYTGQVPGDFASFIAKMAQRHSFPTDQILLGGDHLGPNPWKNEPSKIAMTKAKTLVSEYIKAGYRKIHLDTSMACADDTKDHRLDIEVEAKRAAELCLVAEDAWKEKSREKAPIYVVGTEVPVPGGATTDDEPLVITNLDSVKESLEIYEQVFREYGLAETWNRVVALVVQPGVEFSHSQIHEYDRNLAQPLSKFIETVPGIIYEAHSTDYQLPNKLREMVADHFAILKVGPALTFAFREAVFALAKMETELFHGRRDEEQSHLIATVDRVMLQNPQHWKNYYEGNKWEKSFARKYSFSDRIRYYWSDQQVAVAFNRLLKNLNEKPLPLTLISQYLPLQFAHIRERMINNTPEEMIVDHIQGVLAGYRYACEPGQL